MSKLSFYGVEGAMVRHPNAMSLPGSGPWGQKARFIGYKHDGKGWVLTGEIDSFEGDDAHLVALEVGKTYRDFGQLCLRPADIETADACGVPFDGPKPRAKAAPAPKAPSTPVETPKGDS